MKSVLITAMFLFYNLNVGYLERAVSDVAKVSEHNEDLRAFSV